MAKTVIVDIKGHAFPPVTIPKNTFVVWRNHDPVPHSAETVRDASFYFSAGALHPGEASSPVYFGSPGEYPYLCRYHHGMTGLVTVTDESDGEGGVHVHEPDQGGHGGHGHGFKHLHGFVTGGRSGWRLYMSHTPVLADPRHCYQVILQGSLVVAEQIEAYDAFRLRDRDGAVQVFHGHLSLPDIAKGEITELPKSSFVYYPAGTAGAGESIDGLPDDECVVRIERIIHFHTFEPDGNYPEGLEYLVYGDEDDVFIDHHITRAPNFHSVAKLKQRPSFWTGTETEPTKVLVGSKRIRDVEPKTIKRVAFVDNAFHLFWLPPPGVYPLPADPLTPRTPGSPPAYDVVLSDGRTDQIEIGRFLHFDVRLLNYGVLVLEPPEAG